MSRPVTGTFPAFFANYISKVDAINTEAAVEKYGQLVVDFFKKIPEEKSTYRYAEGKWSLKEMLLHIIDTERIFAYRALTIARKDATPLPSFDENFYALNSNADERSWQNLLSEFEATRKSTDFLVRSFTDEQLQHTGTTSGNPNTVVAICYTIYGHILHHINIINERYL